MKPAHNSRWIAILILFLIIVTFLVGILRAFSSARAALVSDPGDSLIHLIPAGMNPTLTPPATYGGTSLTPGYTPQFPPGPTDTVMPTPAPTLTPMPLPVPITPSADTTGIIGLAILLVVITLVGLAWGGGGPRGKK
jgi:hypothetical protein